MSKETMLTLANIIALCYVSYRWYMVLKENRLKFSDREAYNKIDRKNRFKQICIELFIATILSLVFMYFYFN